MKKLLWGNSFQSIISVSFFLKWVSIFLWLISSLFITRLFSAEAYWLYSVFLVYVSIFSLFFSFWIPHAIPSLFWKFWESSQKKEKNSIYRNWILVIFSLFVIANLLFVLFSSLFSNFFPEFTSLFIFLIMLLGVMTSIKSLNEAILYTIWKIYYAEIGVKLLLPLFFILWLSVLYYLGFMNIGPILAYAFGVFLSLFYSLFFVAKNLWISWTNPPSQEGIRILLQVSWPMLLTWVVSQIISYSDIIMISKMMTLKDVWVYKIVLTLWAFITLGRSVLDQIFMPRIARNFYQNEKVCLKEHLRIYNMYCLWIWALALIGIFLIWKFTLWIFWVEFISWFKALFIISGFLFLTLFMWPTMRYLNATGRQNINFAVVFLWSVTNIIANFYLIQHFWIEWAWFSYWISIFLIYILEAFYILHKDKERIGFTFK